MQIWLGDADEFAAADLGHLLGTDRGLAVAGQRLRGCLAENSRTDLVGSKPGRDRARFVRACVRACVPACLRACEWVCVCVRVCLCSFETPPRTLEPR